MLEFKLGSKANVDELSPTFKVSIQRKSEKRFARTGFSFRIKETLQKQGLQEKSETKKNLKVTPFKFFCTPGTESPIHLKNKGSFSNKSQSPSHKPFMTNSFVNFKAALLRIHSKHSEMRNLQTRSRGFTNKRLAVIGKKYFD